MRAMLRATALVAVALLAACGESASDGSSSAGAASSPRDLSTTLQGLAFDTLFTVGAAEGAPWQAFGGIWDVAAASDGRFAVLDVEETAVHVFDGTGAHVGSVSARGLDPGQLRRPSSLAWAGPGQLLVWDPGSSWISRFSVTETGVAFADRSRAFAFGETGFCSGGGRTYLSYWQDGQIVHEIGPDGATVRSFAPAPPVAGLETLGAPELQEIATEELTPSRLLCAPNGVLDVSFFQSRIGFHDATGTPVWNREIEGFTPIVVYTPDEMGLGRRFDSAGGSHLLRSVVPWAGAALVQHELRTQEVPPEGEIEVVESRLIRLSDGEELDRSRALPLFFAAEGDRVYAVRQEPYPQVVVLTVR